MLRKKVLRFVVTIVALLTLALGPAFAQDASQVLRLFVGFNTQKNSLPLSEETKKQIAALEAKAQQANREKRYGDALRHLHHGLALMRGLAWTPARALAAALQLKAERVVVDPGEVVKLRVTQLFTLEEPLGGTLDGRLTIAPAKPRDRAAAPEEKPPAGQELKTLGAVTADFSTKPLEIAAKLPELADGEYSVALLLQPGAGNIIVKTASLHIVRGLTKQQQALRAAVANATSQYKDNAALLRALAAVEYQLAIPDLVSAGQITSARDFKKEMATAAAYLAQITKGENPLKTLRGDYRWAYRSDVDNTLQPYRVFVPSHYNPAKPTPMVVALHGMGGDENSYFVAYDNGIVKREAEARGYLVVCPKGRGSASMYAGEAEKDVMDVIAALRRDYNVDADRIYLTGHSMGGYGTWSLAPKYPDLFAALAPIAGGGNPSLLSKIKHIPQIVIHGDKDPTVPVERSRVMVKAAQELGIKIKYIEVPGGNHTDIAVPAQKDIFDWFDAHKRQPSAEAKAAAGGKP
jgi:predicted esterase